MTGMNRSKTTTSAGKATAASVLGFLINSVVAGLALAFVILYLWPDVSERLTGQKAGANSAPAPVPGRHGFEGELV